MDEPVTDELPTAIFDKSVLQRIVELSTVDREQAWSELNGRFQLLVPFVLIEEVLVNLGECRLTSPKIVEAMWQDLWRLRSKWIADETDWAFDELVMGRPSGKFRPIDSAFIERMSRLQTQGDDYQEFLKLRESCEKTLVSNRIRAQSEAAAWRCQQKYDGEKAVVDEHGRIFFIVGSEHDFLVKFVKPGFEARDHQPRLWFDMLNQSLGQNLRNRYPNYAAKIEAVLRNMSTERLLSFPGTFAHLLAKLFYFWAPLVKIGRNEQTARTIIGRTEKRQRGNIHDERYVGGALLCQALLTCDKDMAQMATCFRQNDLWHGAVLNLAAEKGRSVLGKIATLPAHGGRRQFGIADHSSETG